MEFFSIFFQSLTLANRLSINILAGSLLINIILIVVKHAFLISFFSLFLLFFIIIIIFYLYELMITFLQFLIFSLLTLEYIF